MRASMFNKKPKIISVLMEYGANITDTDSEKNGVLHFAVKHGQVEVVQILLKFGASPYVLNDAG